MPLKNGIDVITELKAFYKEIAKEFDRELTKDLFVEEPVVVFISAHNFNPQFRDFCKKKGVDYFADKPMRESDLKGI